MSAANPIPRKPPRIVVIGAGAVGLFCALKLADRGAEVRVFDSDFGIASPPTRSASARAAGMLAPLSEQFEASPHHHPGAFELGLEALRLWPQAAASLERFAPSFYSADGCVLAARGSRVSTLMRLSRLAREAGMPARLASKRELPHLAPALDGRAELGLFVENEAQIRVLPAMSALIRGVRRACGAPVRALNAAHIAKSGSGLSVTFAARPPAAAQMETADYVVLAVGGWDGLEAFAPALAHIRPAKGHLLEIASEPGWLPRPLRVGKIYMAPNGERLARIGSNMEFGRRDMDVEQRIVMQLQAELAEVAPVLAFAPILSQWAGVRGMSPDWSPMVGFNGMEGLILAVGLSRNGWLLAPIVAEMVAKLVFGEALTPLEARFAPDRFN